MRLTSERRERAGNPIVGAAIAVGCLAIVACGGQNTITSAWKKVDSCLEQHPSFVGNVVVSNGGGNGAMDSLSVEGSGGALANAFRYRSAADAKSAEQGIGPPGPTVTFYGKIALEINASTSQGDASAIQACFDTAYGASASVQSSKAGSATSTKPGTSPTTTETTHPTTTETTTTSPGTSATLVVCGDSVIGAGTSASISASNERASGVSCETVHNLLAKAWVWRFGVLMWGGVPGTTPGQASPSGWQCRETNEYFSTGDPTQQDDGTLTGSVTRCTSGASAFEVTAGRATSWGHSL